MEVVLPYIQDVLRKALTYTFGLHQFNKLYGVNISNYQLLSRQLWPENLAKIHCSKLKAMLY